MVQIEQKIIQNEQNIIQCDRCSNTFSNMTNLRRHFNRKNICKPLIKEIPIEELKEKYKVHKGCYKCENCGKEYKTSDGKYKHKQKCLINVSIIDKKENDKLKEELEIIKVEKKVLEEELDNKNDSKIISNNKKNININNSGTLNNGYIKNNVVVNVNNYGSQTAMTQKEITKIIKVAMRLCDNIMGNPWDALNYVLQQIHFNPKYPENQNLKLKNFSSPVMDVYKDDKWKKVPFTEQIKLIIESLMEFIDNNQHYVNFSSSYWEELYNKLDDYFLKGENRKYYKNVETSLKCKLYNETQELY
jgi:hypothetical protein